MQFLQNYAIMHRHNDMNAYKGDRLCGLVVRVPACKRIPSATRFSA
jgi:hypothetical protein